MSSRQKTQRDCKSDSALFSAEMSAEMNVEAFYFIIQSFHPSGRDETETIHIIKGLGLLPE